MNLTILDAVKSVPNQPGSINFQPWLTRVEYTYLYDKTLTLYLIARKSLNIVTFYRNRDIYCIWVWLVGTHFSDLFHIHFITFLIFFIPGNLEEHHRGSNWGPREPNFEDWCPRGAKTSKKNFEETKSSKWIIILENLVPREFFSRI